MMSLLMSLLSALTLLSVPLQEFQNVQVYVYCLYGEIVVESNDKTYMDIKRSEVALKAVPTDDQSIIITACSLTDDFMGSVHIKQDVQDKLNDLNSKPAFLPTSTT